MGIGIGGRKSGSPEFPVEPGGFDKLHAPFFTERRTRGLVRRCEAGKPGFGKWLKSARYAR
jgi:hypothetical protein